MLATQQPVSEQMISVRHVTYTHWNKTEPTLMDVSLDIHRGTLNILVGPGGSGKSTLCDLLNGVIPHLSGGVMKGDVWIEGRNVSELRVSDLADQVGRVFQDPEIMFATLSVEDEIAFGPENLRRDVTEIRSTVDELLTMTELTDHRKELVWNLSGGQEQKLGLATVLAMNPEMIVLDEPTSNLDPAATRGVHELILDLRNRGITVLLVTRELDELLAEADQLLVLNAGRIVAAGKPRQVLREHGTSMLDALGIWLPETSEIGIRLLEAGKLGGNEIPITVKEAVEVLTRTGVRLRKEQDPIGADAGAASHGVQSSKCLIHAQGVRYTYPGGTEAVRGIDLDIKAGEWLMILGRNGAGKSTLARMLVGLLKPQSGELTLFGKDAGEWKIEALANRIALVFQNPEHQFLTDRVSDEIDYSLLAQGMDDPSEIRTRTDEMLGLLGLRDVADMHPFSLSAGLKRRLGVATMLVANPQVLVVDEPTYGQDKGMTRTLMSRMQETRAQGVSVVMITHDMRLVEECGERIVVMSGGEVLYDGVASDLFSRKDVLDRANLRWTMLYELVAELRRCGVPLQGEIRRSGDLLRLTEEACARSG